MGQGRGKPSEDLWEEEIVLCLQEGGVGLPGLGGGVIMLDELEMIPRGERMQDPHIHPSTNWLRAKSALLSSTAWCGDIGVSARISSQLSVTVSARKAEHAGMWVLQEQGFHRQGNYETLPQTPRGVSAHRW